MKNAHETSTLATAALLLVAVTACSNTGQHPAATGTSASSPPTAASPSSTATATSDSQVASDAASTLVRDYYALRDKLRQDSTVPLNKLKTIAISTELSAQEKLFKKDRKDGLHQTGDTKISALTVESVDLENSEPAGGQVPTVQIDVCYDVTGVDVLGADGKSIVTAKRPDTGWIRYLVSNYNYKADPTDSWRVASSQSLERTPCDPA